MTDVEEIEHQIRARTAQKIISGHSHELGAQNGIIYVILAYFTCVIGLHNFYAGYYKRGFVQIALTLISPFMMYIPLLIVSLWGLGEMLFINKNANGIKFSGNQTVIWLLRGLGVAFLIYSVMTNELIL